MKNPETISDIEALDDLLSQPNQGVIDALARLEGDILILGVGGKMGPTLARMAKRASDAAGVRSAGRKIIGVSRFGKDGKDELRSRLEAWGIQTLAADLLDRRQLGQLPDAPNVVYMAGMKFGSTGNEPLTWAMNTFLPGMVAQRYARSRIAAFSTGNIYGLSPVVRGGSIESETLNPAGDYAMSCLGRERIFDHFSRAQGTPVTLIRLNYACELRYGVLVDLARKVWEGTTIDLGMGSFNVIWQADANAMALQSLEQSASPAFALNVAGPELLSVRQVCQQFAQLMNKSVRFEGAESPDALLSNGQLGHRLYGYPRIGAQQMMLWIADWVRRGGSSLGKPTHFETRDGKF